MEVFFGLIFVSSSVIVEIYGAQPRSMRFSDLDLPGEPLGQQAKLLQAPLAFSYNQQDTKTSESVIKQRRYKPDPDELPELRKLSSKRMLIPKKYFRNVNKEKELENDEESLDISESTETPTDEVSNAPVLLATPKPKKFVIYVPDENQAPLNSYQVPISVPDLSEEENRSDSNSKKVENEADNTKLKVVQVKQNDQNLQESHHKKHKPKPINTEFEQGHEKDEKLEHHEVSKKKGDKRYKAEHIKYKVDKSHHGEKDKSGKYNEKGGDKKKFSKGHDYEAGQHEEESGQKKSKYEEEAENDKGHATKGTHNIRKKDEYVKKIEFFDEYHEDSDEDEDGGHEDDEDYKKGHHDHKEHRDSAFEYDKYADKKQHEDGHSEKYTKGKHHAASHADHHDHENKHGKKSNHGNKKIWKIIVADKE